MTEVEELYATFQKFWRTGKNARLNVECHAGKVWASLHVSVPQSPPSPQQQYRHHLPRRPTPSRLRRRARRAAARAHAAVEAVASKMNDRIISETGNSVEEADVGDKSLTAAQAVNVAIQPPNKTVPAAIKPNNHDTTADVVEADDNLYQEETLQEHESPSSSRNVLARPWPSEQEEDVAIRFSPQDNRPSQLPEPLLINVRSVVNLSVQAEL